MKRYTKYQLACIWYAKRRAHPICSPIPSPEFKASWEFKRQLRKPRTELVRILNSCFKMDLI